MSKANGTLAAKQLTVDHTVENEDEIRRRGSAGVGPDVSLRKPGGWAVRRTRGASGTTTSRLGTRMWTRLEGVYVGGALGC